MDHKAYSLLAGSLTCSALAYLSNTVQDQFPKDGTDHNGLGLPASIRN